MALADDVAHGIRVLEMLAPEPEGLRVTQVAEGLGINKAIAHRLLGALVSVGYVAQDARTASYFATHRLGALGLRQLSSSGVGTWAQRTLDQLASECEELVRLAVASTDSLQWIAKAQGSNSSLRLDPVMGQDAVPYATASGKAWLASLEQDRVRHLLEDHGLVRQTDRTVTDLGDVLTELQVVRQRGYAMTFEEMDRGINAVAAPVFGAGTGETATGTISIAGPSVRMTRERMEELTPILLEAASQIAASWPSYTYLTTTEQLSA
jgi:IclR family acetate operon transcriptional repressor